MFDSTILGYDLWFCGVLLLLALIILSQLKTRLQANRSPPQFQFGKSGKLRIPTLPYWCPAGHLGKLVFDPLGFLYTSYKSYGEIFTIKLGRRKCTMLCSRELIKQYFNATESQLSLYKFTNSIYANQATTDTFDNMNTIMRSFLQKGFNSHIQQFLETLNYEMETAVKKFKQNFLHSSQQIVEGEDIVRQIYVRAVFKAMHAIELTPDLLSVTEKSFNWFSLNALASIILPPFIVKNTFAKMPIYWRKKYVKLMQPLVNKYFTNTGMNDSILIRALVDSSCEELGSSRKFTEEEVCEVLLTFYLQMVSSPLTACYQILKELTHRHDLWSSLKKELTGACVDDISRNKTLQACVIEGLRLNTNLILSARANIAQSTIGDYNLEDTDLLVVPGALLFEMKPAEDVFKNARCYNPNRFLQGKPEPMDFKSIWIWGGGAHTCPGRNLSLLCMKIFVTHFVHEFDAEVAYTSQKSYMSLRSVAGQKVKFRLVPT